MKKFVIGILVSVVFVVYSLVLRHQHSSSVIAPITTSKSVNNSNNSAIGSQSSSSSSSSNSQNSNSSSSSSSTAAYKDGTYTGDVENAFYGNIQISATISGGQITNVKFLQYPDENPNSININSQAMPYLKQEAIQAQSANVSGVSGATLSSQAFIQSLQTALQQAKS